MLEFGPKVLFVIPIVIQIHTNTERRLTHTHACAHTHTHSHMHIHTHTNTDFCVGLATIGNKTSTALAEKPEKPDSNTMRTNTQDLVRVPQ